MGSEVRLDLVGGRVHRGRMVAADTEVLVVATHDGATAYVAPSAVVALRTGGVPADTDASHPDRAGSRLAAGPAVDTPGTLAEVLCDLADRCRTADIGVIGGARYRGRVRAAGGDVVALADGRCLRLQMVTDVVATP